MDVRTVLVEVESCMKGIAAAQQRIANPKYRFWISTVDPHQFIAGQVELLQKWKSRLPDAVSSDDWPELKKGLGVLSLRYCLKKPFDRNNDPALQVSDAIHDRLGRRSHVVNMLHEAILSKAAAA
jgi:hypothetical protein